jgi:Ferritin-like domain
MSDALNLVYETIDDRHAGESAATRRQLVAGAAATLGAMGILGLAEDAQAGARAARHRVDPTELLAVAATAEVLATIVNTVGFERVGGLDAVTRKNIAAAAREELIHFEVLTSPGVGAKELTRRIWVPDAVFASPTAFLTTLEVGDTLFVNAYLLATTVFGNRRNGRLARIAAEFMGVEAVHRALARQSLGKLGNDRVFQRYSQGEEAPALPTTGQGGYTTPGAHVAFLRSLGFGFGAPGNAVGAFYEFDAVSARTPTAAAIGALPGTRETLNTLTPR